MHINRNTGRQCQGGTIDEAYTIGGSPGLGVDDFQVQAWELSPGNLRSSVEVTIVEAVTQD